MCAAHDWVFVLHCLCLNIVLFTFAWSCCYNLIYANVCQCCLFNLYVVNWHAKCVPREPISRGSASQTADGILRCGPSVSISHLFPCVGSDPEGSTRFRNCCCRFKCWSSSEGTKPRVLNTNKCSARSNFCLEKLIWNLNKPLIRPEITERVRSVDNSHERNERAQNIWKEVCKENVWARKKKNAGE